jgi:hypothetical protein
MGFERPAMPSAANDPARLSNRNPRQRSSVKVNTVRCHELALF